jgi:hypothetical protein
MQPPPFTIGGLMVGVITAAILLAVFRAYFDLRTRRTRPVRDHGADCPNQLEQETP